VSLIICDESNPSGVKVRIFAEDEKTLPRVSSNGDIVIFAGMRVTNYQNQTILLATNIDKYRYMMSRLPSIPTSAATTVGYPTNVHVSPADLAYVGKLRLWWSKTGGNGLSQVTYSQPSDPNTVTVAARQSSPYVGFSLINKMELRKFYDCVCQVVKVFPQESYLSVYITDYTTNKLLHAYDWTQMKLVEDEHADAAPKWNGPWGYFTMQVTLWDANAEAGRQLLHEGQYVFFRKLNTKENRDGKMEGALHGDRKYPNKVNFSVIQDLDKNQHIRAIRMRARQYERIWEENHKERYETFIRERAVEAARHKERDRASEEAIGNPKIAIQKCPHPVTSIRDILKPPHSGERYENRKYRILCKVIDYRPHNLADFAQPEEPSDGDSDESITPSLPSKKWVWRFALLVQGEDDEALRVIVADKGAEFLLNMPATE
jgi:protection-of-telomeres protein 1